MHIIVRVRAVGSSRQQLLPLLCEPDYVGEHSFTTDFKLGCRLCSSGP